MKQPHGDEQPAPAPVSPAPGPTSPAISVDDAPAVGEESVVPALQRPQPPRAPRPANKGHGVLEDVSKKKNFNIFTTFSHNSHTTEPIFMIFCRGVLLHEGEVIGA